MLHFCYILQNRQIKILHIKSLMEIQFVTYLKFYLENMRALTSTIQLAMSQTFYLYNNGAHQFKLLNYDSEKEVSRDEHTSVRYLCV